MSKQTHAQIGTEAVIKATAKSWDEWFAVLDAAGAKAMAHKEIVAVLRDRHRVGPWWQQMITVGYEQARGLRVKHQKATGFSISRSKTIGASAATVFAAWKDKRRRSKWLADGDFTIRKATPSKSLRITWIDGETKLDVQFFAKGEDRCQVAIEHARLKSAREAAKLKAYWGEQLDHLKAMLEGKPGRKA
jgi:uncharacterized protein YndB with AHSA1/START domain